PVAPFQRRAGFATGLFSNRGQGLAVSAQGARPDRYRDAGRHHAGGGSVLREVQPDRRDPRQIGFRAEHVPRRPANVRHAEGGDPVTKPLATLCTAARIMVLVAVMVSVFAAGTQAASLQQAQKLQSDPRQMRFEPVEFNPPEPERLVLENGMVVYLLEDHELPLVTITATMRTGGWLDPADKVGLAGIAGTTMRTGGTKRMTAAEVDVALEQLAAHISVGIGTESGSAMLDGLRKDLTGGLRIFGDFNRAAMLAELREVFGDWPKGEILPIVLPPPQTLGADDGRAQKKILRFVRKGTSQTHLRAGHLSVKENDPDYPALALLNDILGGSSFRSRLFQDIRTKQGLAYSVRSALRVGMREPGVWLVRAETKLGSTQEVISRLVSNLERLREQSVTDAELDEAKEAFVNSFVFSFSSSSAIVSRLIGLEYDGLPKDFLHQLRDKVVKLTKEDLLAAARKHLYPERLRILAVGPPESLLRVLSGFGEVEEIKLEPEG